MAAYIERDKPTVCEFNQMYRRMASQIRQRADTGRNSPHTLHTLWLMSLEKMQKGKPDSFHPLCTIYFLAPDEIPLVFFDPEDREVDDDDIWTDYSMFCDEYIKVEKAVSQLKGFALVRPTGRFISIHRLLQKAALDSFTKEYNEAFQAAVNLINHAFPKQVHGRPLYTRGAECQAAIQHSFALTRTWTQRAKKRNSKVDSCEELQQLMTTSVGYMYELGELSEALELLEMAYKMFPGKTTLLYAHLCNSEAAIQFELNSLKRRREMNEKSLALRSAILPDNSVISAGCYVNLRLLNGSESSLDESIALLKKGEQLRTNAGALEEVQLRVTHVIVGHGKQSLLRTEYSRMLHTINLSVDSFDKFNIFGEARELVSIKQ
ncbi:hypothetical protein B0J14DRAFT_707932 [Halenospora varia]|nr:hypothetical protein B0J14DRAFT_707932 [Halenospora varia]